MRASVGLLDRNIKITRQGSWGYGVIIYSWKDEI
jgi:hypothetical protein